MRFIKRYVDDGISSGDTVQLEITVVLLSHIISYNTFRITFRVFFSFFFLLASNTV